MVFDGWSWKEWARGNKESLKLTLVASAGFVLYGLEFIPDPKLKALVTGVAMAVGKLGLDSFHFWLGRK